MKYIKSIKSFGRLFFFHIKVDFTFQMDNRTRKKSQKRIQNFFFLKKKYKIYQWNTSFKTSQPYWANHANVLGLWQAPLDLFSFLLTLTFRKKSKQKKYRRNSVSKDGSANPGVKNYKMVRMKCLAFAKFTACVDDNVLFLFSFFSIARLPYFSLLFALGTLRLSCCNRRTRRKTISKS